MKKRSKRLLAMQQNLPGVRVREQDSVDDALVVNGSLGSRGNEGTARNLKFTSLREASRFELGKMLRKSFGHDAYKNLSDNSIMRTPRFELDRAEMEKGELKYALGNMRDKNIINVHRAHRKSFTYKEKNSCFFLGKGRTFNRKLLVSRHSFRHLASFGLLAGVRGG